jgi:hypothetical protein
MTAIKLVLKWLKQGFTATGLTRAAIRWFCTCGVSIARQLIDAFVSAHS